MNQITIILRICLLLIVLYFLFLEVNIQQTLSILRHSHTLLLCAAAFCYLLKYILHGLRWYNAANAHALYRSPTFFIKSQIEIAFLEMALPIPDSEDALRIVRMKQVGGDMGTLFIIILFDRMIGIFFLLLLLPFSFLLVVNVLSINLPLNRSFLFCACTAVLVFVVFYRRILMFLLKLLPRFWGSNSNFFRDLYLSLSVKPIIKYQLWGFAGVVSFALAGALCIWLIAFSLDIQVPFSFLFFSIPLYYVSQIFPLSYQGLGLYEATLIYLFQRHGIPKEQAVAVGTLHFILHLLIILTGGAIFAVQQPYSIKDLKSLIKRQTADH